VALQQQQDRSVSAPLCAYAAARALRRDRQTVVRVTDRMVPDAFDQQGHPLWRIERIATVLAMSPRERRDAGRFRDRYGIRDETLDRLLIAFEKQVTAIGAEPAPAMRHAMAVALAPVLRRYEASYLSVGRSLSIADDIDLSFNIDLIMEEAIEEAAEAAGLERDAFFTEMNEAMALADDEVA
jgi:hypothetical protein